MRLLLKETDKRVELKLDKSIKANGVYGIVMFGEKNDYPQTVERIVLSSIDAKAVANIYAKFLVGGGFENEAINSIVIGKDFRGRNITMLSLLRQAAYHASIYSGFYIHTNVRLDGLVGNARIVPFKDCRFSKPDNRGYVAKVAVYDNWEKDKLKKYDTKEIRFYNLFNLQPDVLRAQFAEAGGFHLHKGQIYPCFLDEAYIYPLSPFDPVYLDCDTQSQISIFKNNQIRNGFTDKSVFRLAGDEDSIEEMASNIRKMMGADGDNCTIIEDTINPETGKLDDKSQVVVDKIATNINPDLFKNWEQSITNAIRKANKALPQVLIDYETSQLGTTSGEAIQKAVEFYNAMTEDDRGIVSDAFRTIFSQFNDLTLRNNENWRIKPLEMVGMEAKDTIDMATQEKLKSQAMLKGSVGGVTALLELQRAVSEGTADIEAAVAIVVEIYGISDETARKMIGKPKEGANGTV